MKLNRALGVCIVTYKPDLIKLKSIIEETLKIASKIIIVDNTISPYTSELNYSNRITVVQLKKNVGIAKAQNVAIDILQKDLRIDKILFLDQDSFFDKKNIHILLINFEKIKAEDPSVAAVGPIPINSRTNIPYLNQQLRREISEKKYMVVSEIISSGTLTEKVIFELSGKFLEHLFIDYVDHEWCWRLKSFGRKCYLISESKLIHNLGESDDKPISTKLYIPKPERNYYQYRNYFELIGLKHVPFKWKVKTFIKLTSRPILVLMVFPEKLKHCKFIGKGILDGILQKNKNL